MPREVKWCEHIFYMKEASRYVSCFKFMREVSANFISDSWNYCPLCGAQRPKEKKR